MAHVPDEQALQSLQKDVAKALDTLQILTRTKASRLVGKSQTLPLEEIELAAGLIFLHTAKAGFVASLVTGHGFLIKKVAFASKVLLRLPHRVFDTRRMSL